MAVEVVTGFLTAASDDTLVTYCEADSVIARFKLKAAHYPIDNLTTDVSGFKSGDGWVKTQHDVRQPETATLELTPAELSGAQGRVYYFGDHFDAKQMKPGLRRSVAPVAVNFGRRHLLKVGAGAAARAALCLPALAVAGEPMSDAELFAFASPCDSALVFAVTFPVQDDLRWSSTPAVRLHAAQKSWSVGNATAPAFIPGVADQFRAFVGRSMRMTEAGARACHLVVVTVPRSAVPAGCLGIWAEIGDSDTRVRVGNPIVAELLNQDPALARVFHRASPSQDVRLFGEAIAQRIAMRGAETMSRRTHGERLAAMLLPDVLPFDPAFPVGYTFANQNGRRPSDPVAAVVATVLAGVVTARPPVGGAFGAAPTFPYFEILEA